MYSRFRVNDWTCAVAAILSVSAIATAQQEARKPQAVLQALSPTDDVIRLFNGQDMSRLYTRLDDTKYDDPRGVFTIHDGLLHISGDGFGGVITKDAYRDYRLRQHHLVLDGRPPLVASGEFTSERDFVAKTWDAWLG